MSISCQVFCSTERKAGSLQLYTKSVERAHTPSKLWERTELSSKYDEALDQISHQLLHWYVKTIS